MPPHVLVAYDDSAQAEAALKFALESVPAARVTLLTVVDPVDTGSRRRIALPAFGDQWLERARENASETLDDATDRVRDVDDVDVDATIEVGRPANTIVEYADTHDVDHVVMGSHGRSGVTRILLGSVAETVVRRSPVPVTVARDHHTQDEPAESESASSASEDATNEVSGESSA
jgi:nucleotide-binding universal stress UspA family protein